MTDTLTEVEKLMCRLAALVPKLQEEAGGTGRLSREQHAGSVRRVAGLSDQAGDLSVQLMGCSQTAGFLVRCSRCRQTLFLRLWNRPELRCLVTTPDGSRVLDSNGRDALTAEKHCNGCRECACIMCPKCASETPEHISCSCAVL